MSANPLSPSPAAAVPSSREAEPQPSAIYSMSLHDQLDFASGVMRVTRVYRGWIYQFFDQDINTEAAVFVPDSGEPANG